MFEVSFLRFLDSIDNEEVRKIALYLREKQIIFKLKNMSDEDFIKFKEIILSNFNAIDEMFNYIIHQRGKEIDSIDSFLYDDLFQYYYVNVKNILSNNHLTLACIQTIYDNFMVPFYKYKEDSLLALGSRDSYISYLENNLDHDYVAVEKIYNFNCDLYNYFEDEIGCSFEKDHFEPSDLELVDSIIKNKRKDCLTLGSWPLDRVNHLFDDFKRENDYVSRDVDEKLELISTFEKRLINIKKLVKRSFIFLNNKDIEEMKAFYNELFISSNGIITLVNVDIVNKKHVNLFKLYSYNDKEVYSFFKDNINNFIEYIKLLISGIECYHNDRIKYNNKKHIGVLMTCYPNMQYLSNNTMEFFIEHNLNFGMFEKYYYVTNEKAKLYEFLNVYLSEDDKDILKEYLKKVSNEKVYADINEMLIENGCSDIDITTEGYIDKLIYYYLVKQDLESVCSVNEKEIFSNIFKPIYGKVKK